MGLQSGPWRSAFLHAGESMLNVMLQVNSITKNTQTITVILKTTKNIISVMISVMGLTVK